MYSYNESTLRPYSATKCWIFECLPKKTKVTLCLIFHFITVGTLYIVSNTGT